MQFSDQHGYIPNEGLLAGTAAGAPVGGMRDMGIGPARSELHSTRGMEGFNPTIERGTMDFHNYGGFEGAQRAAKAAHKRRVSEAARLYANVLAGREHPILMQEALSPRTPYIVEHLRRNYPGLYLDSRTGRTLGLRETMSVTDYQALYVDVLDRMYYGFYSAYPIVNKSLVKMHTLRDFRLVSRYLLDGAVTPFTSMDAAAPPPQRGA